MKELTDQLLPNEICQGAGGMKHDRHLLRALLAERELSRSGVINYNTMRLNEATLFSKELTP
jgi:hypothetical protein